MLLVYATPRAGAERKPRLMKHLSPACVIGPTMCECVYGNDDDNDDGNDDDSSSLRC